MMNTFISIFVIALLIVVVLLDIKLIKVSIEYERDCGVDFDFILGLFATITAILGTVILCIVSFEHILL